MPTRIVLTDLSSLSRALRNLSDVANGLLTSHFTEETKVSIVLDELLEITEDVRRMAQQASIAEHSDYDWGEVKPMSSETLRSYIVNQLDHIYNPDNPDIDLNEDAADRHDGELTRGDQ